MNDKRLEIMSTIVDDVKSKQFTSRRHINRPKSPILPWEMGRQHTEAQKMQADWHIWDKI